MSSILDRIARPVDRLPLVALAACATLALAPATASAVAGSGSVALTLGGSGKAAKSLAGADVKAGTIAPAKKRGNRVTLPVRSIAVGKSATILLRGGVSFKAGKRSLKLKSVKVELTTGKATVSAKAGKSRIPVFASKLAKGKAQLNRSKLTAELAGAGLALTSRGAKLLRDRLDVTGVAAGKLGRLSVVARSKSRTNGGPNGAPGGPESGPLGKEPPFLARPAGAVEVTNASLTWRPRDSWICYVNGGEGTSVFGGAASGSPETLACPSGPVGNLVASFHGFPLKNGWYHAATGTAAIYFQGGVGFKLSDHGIDFSTANPEIEINGGASRAIFTFVGSDDTEYDSQRGVLVDLHPDPIQTPASGTVIYANVAGTIPEDTGASVFAGYYPANAPFGSVTVSFTTPTP